MIATRAYEIFLERREVRDAHPAEDWLVAENEILPLLIEKMVDHNRRALASHDDADPVASKASEHMRTELDVPRAAAAKPKAVAKKAPAASAAKPKAAAKPAAKKTAAKKAPAKKAAPKKAASEKAKPAAKPAAKKAPARPARRKAAPKQPKPE